ncbi:hypothetical protein R0135_01235 [Congregibacter variabilis]|uniref:Uncharacterized protein n=1 Tax=Congregibacter variabilis TaxID=3081200 RepID=A0ABZ0I3Q6_9GAMM|nr:hypothetical protein R0135_01235 [Congregibacter sp. IMCC43200]
MILRSLTKHLKEQNWFAVGLDFSIVVIGVFIGIQVANWNEARAEYKKETEALIELRNELRSSILLTRAKGEAYDQAAEAGRRSLAFLDTNNECITACWDRLVDFMHASQWQSLEINHSSYRNMRDQGFPTSALITKAVEAYLAQVDGNVNGFDVLPVYRSLVRQVINIEAQEYYWEKCWSLVDGIEKYNLNCPEGIPPGEATMLVNEVIDDPSIERHLTEWVGAIVSLPLTLRDQNLAAQRAVDLISEEIERR